MQLRYTLSRVASLVRYLRALVVLHYIAAIAISLLDLALYAVIYTYVRRATYPTVFWLHLVVRRIPGDLRRGLTLKYKEYLSSNLSLTGFFRYLGRVLKE